MKTKSLIKPLIFTALLATALLSFFSAREKLPASDGLTISDPCHTKNVAFLPGEELTYKVFYNWGFVWLSAAEITFKVIDEDDQYHFQVVGETYETYDWFFKVRDYYDSWVMKDNLLPIQSIRNIEEGKYRLYDYLMFDQSRGICYNDRGKAKNDIRSSKEYKIDRCMHDMVSILYFARNIDFSQHKAGQKFPIKIFADKEVWNLQVKYEGKEAGKTVKGKGDFNTLKFSPEVIAGEVFPDDAQVHVWVTDDQNKLPLIIESPLSVGSVKAVLKNYKGLRHPLRAKVGK